MVIVMSKSCSDVPMVIRMGKSYSNVAMVTDIWLCRAAVRF